jgi:3-vinyl bacteriochlorophyllide hydratase
MKASRHDKARHDRPADGQLYTPEQRARRDATKWTLVQGVLAPLQFVVFAVSLALVVRYLATGEGYVAATVSILVKTAVLYTIMVTGAIWEKVVFGQYLLAPAFFWEDVVSFGVIALHTLYVYAVLFADWGSRVEMWIALAAYAAYVVNAVQFVWKLRQARLSAERADRAAAAAQAPEPQATEPTELPA